MKKSYKLWVISFGLWIGVMFPGASMARAAITLGSGFYTNLCDSGTKATYYNCDKRCDVTRGTCTSNDNGVVKYVCYGKWNQCLESESQWSNYEQVGNANCGYTVQLSLFDRKCRREDGSWDSNCQLLGYMVWYSGDCRPEWVQPSILPTPTKGLIPQPTAGVKSSPSPTPAPAINPLDAIKSKLSGLVAGMKTSAKPSSTPTVTIKPTNKPSITPTTTPTPSAAPVVGMCGAKCKLAYDCSAGFACVSGFCRNPVCTSDTSCFCKGSEAIALVPVVTAKKTPDTGVETWLGMAGMLGIGLAGMKLFRLAKKIW